MKPKNIIIFLVGIVIVYSCKKTPEAPTGGNKIEIGNTTADSVSYNSATISTTLNSTGGNDITQHGHCWSTSSNPEITDNHTSLGQTLPTNKFTSRLSNLIENTHYYFRPYISLFGTTIYGVQVEKTIPQLGLPTVSTSVVSNITATSAQGGGNVTSNGNGTVSARGVCWNTTGNPTLTNSLGHTTDGTGTGIFTSNMTGLNDGTTYYVTAYATNEKGTIYSTDIKQFIAQNQPCGQLTVNYGGQTYHTVKIGNQCWFKENLNVGTRIDGSQNQDPTNQTIEKYCYADNESNCDTYGGLYQWDELMKNSTKSGVKGICPDGWHIPTDGEWTILTDFLGGESVAGGKMKEAGYVHWDSPNTGATNTSGFTALPGGYWYYGNFVYLANLAYFWSSSESSTTHARYRRLYYDFENVYRGSSNKIYGCSARCLQD